MFRISLILLSIVLNVIGEVYLKYSINHLDFTLSYSTALNYLLNVDVLLSITCIIVSSIFWLISMSYFQLSFLYPFLGLNYLGVIVLSSLILQEPLSLKHYLSTGFIIIGLLCLSKSKNHAVKQIT